MKCKLIFFFMVLGINQLHSQEDLVKKIRQDYIEYNTTMEKIQQGESDNMISPFKIKTSQIRPALGPVEIEIQYYFDEKSKSGESVDPENPTYIGILRKVVYQESMPSFTDHREIFFDSNGELSFFYSKLTGLSCGEKRMYFNVSKMIKIKFNPLEGGECQSETPRDNLPDFTRYPDTFSKEDKEWEKWIISYSLHHKKTFQNLFESLQ